MQTAQGVAKVALSEAASMHGQVEERIQPYILRMKAGMLHAIGESTQ